MPTKNPEASAVQEQVIAPGALLEQAFSLLLLHHARIGNALALEKNLKEGADPNYQDAEGMTSLHYAAAHGARPCIRVLVDGGRCNYLLKDKLGRYASELAYKWGRDYAVGELLSKKEAMQAHREGVEL